MIKTKVTKTKCFPDPVYPRLLVHNSDKNFVVLEQCCNRGVVLSSGKSTFYSVGDGISDSALLLFSPFTGSITLTQE